MSAGDGLEAGNANWRFRGEVVKNFDEHAKKSIPFYVEGHELICRLSDYFVKDGSVCYEIGCATGELTLKLAMRNAHCEKTRFVGIDHEDEMIQAALARKEANGVENVRFIMDDILQAELEPCDMIVSHYTLQFVRPSIRQDVFNKIYNSLKWGGAFILFEKVRGKDARFQDIMSSLYVDYKLSQGYTAEEIVEKSRSLKGVLEPFSTQGNMDLMRRAGFVDVMTVMKYVSFEGFLAIK